MSIYKSVKKALTNTVDAVVDKTTTQAQKNRLKAVMAHEARITNEAYIELGKFYYNNCRNGASEHLEEVFAIIDDSKQRMSRAQEKYREVLQQELINKEIATNEARENLRSIKEPIVAKAKNTADKAKDKAEKAINKVGGIKDAAAEKAADIKEKLPKAKHSTDSNDDEIAEGIFDTAVEDAIESVIGSDEDIAVVDAIEQAVADSVATSVNEELAGRATTESSEAEDVQPIEYPGDLDEPDASYAYPTYYDPAPSLEKTDEIFSYSEFTPVKEKSAPSSQEIQREIPADIISEEDFAADEPKTKAVKKRLIPAAKLKSRKLKDVIGNQAKHTAPADED